MTDNNLHISNYRDDFDYSGLIMKLFKISFNNSEMESFFNSLYFILKDYIKFDDFSVYRRYNSDNRIQTICEIDSPTITSIYPIINNGINTNISIYDHKHLSEFSDELANNYKSLAVVRINWENIENDIIVMIWNRNQNDFSKFEQEALVLIAKQLILIINNFINSNSSDLRIKIQELMEFVTDFAIIIDKEYKVLFANQIAIEKLYIPELDNFRFERIIHDTEMIIEYSNNSHNGTKEIYTDLYSGLGTVYPVRLLLSKIHIQNSELMLILARDINEEHYFRDTEIKLERDSKLFQKVSDFILKLLESDDIIKTTRSVIPHLYTLLQADYVFLALHNDENRDNNFQTIISHPENNAFDNFNNNDIVTIDEQSQLMTALLENQTINYDNVNDEISSMLEFGIQNFKSISLAPIFINHQLHGIIGIVHTDNIKKWFENELHSLSIISNAIGVSLERKNTMRDMMVARESAEYAYRAKSDFLACMSHEVRTPLNAIVGMSELLNMTVEDEEQLEFVHTIFDSANQLTNIINDILDLSSIDSGSFTLENKLFNFRDFIKKLVYTLALDASKKNLEVIVDIDNSIPIELIGDPNRVRQVFVNIISNAIKFTKQGEIMIKLKQIELVDSYIKIQTSISDTGIGIPNEKLNVIFESFGKADYSTANTNRGTGLGLTMSKKMIELMGGSISVSSVLNFGSTFTFDMILKEPGKVLNYEIIKSKEENYYLIIEPNPSTLSIIRNYISQISQNIVFCNSYQNALAVIQTNTNSGVVFSDIIIGQDSDKPDLVFELIRQIKASYAELDNSRLIMLSKGEFSQLDQFFLLNNKISCIQKPVFPEDIYNFLEV